MYKSSTRIVSCVYYSDRDGIIGGRSWPEDYYKWTLFNIFNIGLPVTLFCSPAPGVKERVQQIVDNCKQNVNPQINVEILLHDMLSHPRAVDIINNRSAILDKMRVDKATNPHGVYWTRNEVICHTKLMFVKKVFEHYQDIENVVWLDAGITHWGLTPRSVGGMEINGGAHTFKDFYPNTENNVFRPSLGAGFERLMQDHEFVVVGHHNNWYDSNIQWIHAAYLLENPELKEIIDPDNKWFLLEDGRVSRERPKLQKQYPGLMATVQMHEIKQECIQVFKNQIIGGIFGIRRSKIDFVYNFYYKLLDFMLYHKHKTLFTEEPIFSLYHNLYNPHFIQFTDWSHNVPHDPPNPCTTDGNFVKSFYTVWKDITDYTTTSPTSAL